MAEVVFSSALCIFSFWDLGGKSSHCLGHSHSQGAGEEQEACANHTLKAFAQT